MYSEIKWISLLKIIRNCRDYIDQLLKFKVKDFEGNISLIFSIRITSKTN